MRNVARLGSLALALVPVGAFLLVRPGPGPDSRGTGLTIYTENLGLVRSRVERVLEPGRQTIRIDGLPTSIDGSSLLVLNDGVVLLGTHDQRTYQGRAGTGASIELDLDVKRRVGELQLAYLTAGLGWSTAYSMVVSRDDRSAEIDGFATLVNGSGTGYDGAEVQLLAGRIQRGTGGGRIDGLLRAASRVQESVAATPTEAAFGGYHLYTLPDTLWLAAGDSRRIRLLGAASVHTTKEYTTTSDIGYGGPQGESTSPPVVMSYRVDRPEGAEFSDTPLPAGPVRVFQADGEGRLQLLGISSLENTPAGEDLNLVTGVAFDVTATRTQTDFQRTGSNAFESAWRIALKNRSERPVTVQIIERLSGDWRIIESNQTPEKLSAGAVRFRVPVPAQGEAALTYRVSVRR